MTRGGLGLVLAVVLLVSLVAYASFQLGANRSQPQVKGKAIPLRSSDVALSNLLRLWERQAEDREQAQLQRQLDKLTQDLEDRRQQELWDRLKQRFK